MLEVRYRVTPVDGARHPLDAWFAREGAGVVHGLDFRFEDDMGRGRFVATGPRDAAFRRFVEDVVATAVPRARSWECVRSDARIAIFEAEWREPMFGEVRSPMKVHADILGAQVDSSVTVRRGEVVHRALVPMDCDTQPLWRALRDELEKARRLSGMRLVLHLDRVGPWPELRRDERAEHVARTAYLLGYYDTPRRAGLAEVCEIAGVPEDEARAILARVEQESLRS